MLQRFVEDFDKFSINRYIWNKIHDASEDPMRHLPYAPYLMHVIEQVSGIRFPTDSSHKVLKITNKTSIIATRELKKASATSHASFSRSRRGASPLAASRASSAEPLSSSSSSKKPSKFKFLMTYMFGQCYASSQREHDMQERLYHLEQHAGIESSPAAACASP